MDTKEKVLNAGGDGGAANTETPVIDAKTMLEQGRVEEVIKLLEAKEIVIYTKAEKEAFRQRASQLYEEKEMLRTERDHLLKTWVLLYRNFGFVLDAAKSANDEKASKSPSTFTTLLAKLIGVKIPVEATAIVWAIVKAMKSNHAKIMAAIPVIGEMLPGLVEIMTKYGFIKADTAGQLKSGEEDGN